jgi:hypothetical protein
LSQLRPRIRPLAKDGADLSEVEGRASRGVEAADKSEEEKERRDAEDELGRCSLDR